MARIGTNVVTGINDVLKNMDKLDKDINRKIVKPAIKKGIIPIKKQAKKNAKWKSIRKLIRSRVFIAKSGNVIGKVFLSKSKDRFIILEGRKVGFEVVGSILEFGRKKGNLKPQPYMRTAREEKKAEAIQIVKKEISKGLKIWVASRIKI